MKAPSLYCFRERSHTQVLRLVPSAAASPPPPALFCMHHCTACAPGLFHRPQVVLHDLLGPRAEGPPLAAPRRASLLLLEEPRPEFFVHLSCTKDRLWLIVNINSKDASEVGRRLKILVGAGLLTSAPPISPLPLKSRFFSE